MLTSEKTSAGTQERVEEPFGAILALRVEEECGDTVVKLPKDYQKVFGDQKVLVTEVSKPRPEQERHAKLGQVNHLKSMEILQLRNQLSDLKVTYAETQTVVTPSGAILLTQRRDGSTVIQSWIKPERK